MSDVEVVVFEPDLDLEWLIGLEREVVFLPDSDEEDDQGD